MITPCIVNSRLYASGELSTSPWGVISSSRMMVAAAPPTKKKNVIEAIYKSATRLWSVVSNHDFSVYSWR